MSGSLAVMHLMVLVAATAAVLLAIVALAVAITQLP